MGRDGKARSELTLVIGTVLLKLIQASLYRTAHNSVPSFIVHLVKRKIAFRPMVSVDQRNYFYHCAFPDYLHN